MAYTVEFLKNYPELLERYFLEMDDDLADEFLRVLYDGYKGLLCARANADEKVFGNSMDYMFVAESCNSSDPFEQIFWVLLKSVHFGDQQKARDLFRNQFSEIIKSSAFRFVVENMAKTASAGEKFFNSEGHNKRAQSIRERNQKIADEFAKHVNNGLDKAAAYSRLENAYSLTTRQLQRIIKKPKSDI